MVTRTPTALWLNPTLTLAAMPSGDDDKLRIASLAVFETLSESEHGRVAIFKANASDALIGLMTSEHAPRAVVIVRRLLAEPDFGGAVRLIPHLGSFTSQMASSGPVAAAATSLVMAMYRDGALNATQFIEAKALQPTTGFLLGGTMSTDSADVLVAAGVVERLCRDENDFLGAVQDTPADTPVSLPSGQCLVSCCQLYHAINIFYIPNP